MRGTNEGEKGGVDAIRDAQIRENFSQIIYTNCELSPKLRTLWNKKLVQNSSACC